jgi:hypothetical protein
MIVNLVLFERLLPLNSLTSKEKEEKNENEDKMREIH